MGRTHELGVLERALEAVAAGGSRIVAFRGEPGIGKSRLLFELAERCEQRGFLVTSGRAAELERDLTFGLLVNALERLFSDVDARRVTGLEVEQQHELAAVFPAIERLAGVEAVPVSGERHRLARAVQALLGQVAARRPVAVLFDDVQWADPASADVVTLLVHRRPPGGVLLALAARGGPATALDASLLAAERDGSADVLELGPLQRATVDEFLPNASHATRERLYLQSGGNPFYLQELARARRSGVGGVAEASLAGVPRAVLAALAAELAVLPTRVRLVLEGAAVAGDPFEPELAAAAADVEESAVLAALDPLLSSDLVRPTVYPRRFRFRHPLVRAAVYEEAGGGWRLAAHDRMAAVLAARGATPAQRAHHVERAAVPGDLAAGELLAAAAQEVVGSAPTTAAGWYEAALRLLPDAVDHEQRRLELLAAHGRALASANRPQEARDVLGLVLEKLPRETAEERVRVVELLAEIETWSLHNSEEARRLLRSERSALADSAPRLVAALTAAMARERFAEGDFDTAYALAEEGRRAAGTAGERPLEAVAAATAATAGLWRLRGDDVVALAEVDGKIDDAQAMVEALADDQVAARVQGLWWLGLARVNTGSLASARSVAEHGLVLARRTGHGLQALSFLSLRAAIDVELGDLDAATETVDEQTEALLVARNDNVAYGASFTASWIALARGNADAALAHGERAWRHTGVVARSWAGWIVADARLALGDAHGAMAALERFGKVNPGMQTLGRLRALEVLVRVLLALGRVDEASDWARRAPAEGGGRRSGVYGSFIASAQARVLLAQDAGSEAACVALAGAAAADEGLAPLWAGRCRTLAGEALAANGNVEHARRELRRAVAELGDRGAWGYRDAALKALRQLGDRPHAAAPPSADRSGDARLAAVSPREREVALLVAEGRTNAQIAAQLHLSERTIEKHVSSVLAKLGLSSRTGIVRLLAEYAQSSVADT
jgi:DNA-binding CsgD family transcriptional regulator